MTEFLIYILNGVLSFEMVLLLIVLSNRRILQRLKDNGRPTNPPPVSILLPARNEAHNIEMCVRSLLAQRYPDFEVLVLDDHSTDETWPILTRLAAEDSRLQLIKGQPLPADWLGKHWACHQLARRANGDLLLFTDADTRHHPQVLADAVAALQSEQADLLTVLPRQEVITWGERLVVPIIPWSIGAIMPLALAYRLPWPALAVGVGQFMLFQRRAYEAIGGYEAVKQHVVDDITLARRMKASGLRWRLADGSQRVCCRMYQNFGQAREGLSKNLFGAFNYNAPLFIFVWGWLAIVFAGPPLLLMLGLVGLPLLPPMVKSLSALAIGLALLLWGIVYGQFRLPLYLTFLYPLTIMLAVYLAARSLILSLTGQATWKGRRLTKPRFKLTKSPSLPPQPSGKVSWLALQAWLRQGHILAALETLHRELGNVFRIPLPGFNPVVLVGPEANRFVFLTGQERLLWRAESDPVTRLLRHGVLVEDGPVHQQLRSLMAPALHRRRLDNYVSAMVNCVERVCAAWDSGAPRDMLVEMRRVALLILVQTLFGVDFGPDLKRLWPSIMRLLAYISPGAWLIWPNIPRPGYRPARRQMDDYLFRLIRARRNAPDQGDDLLSLLVATPGLSDDLIRDQLLTMLIAGHDTSTALLAWTLYLLGRHPEVLTRLQAEIDTVLGDQPPDYEDLKQLRYLEQVIKESLRLYPPIHLGQRIAAADFTFQDYHIPAGMRVIYSIYLTHRDPNYWPEPARFDPERFSLEKNQRQAPHTYIPFGGGTRNCIGAGFGLVEAKVVLARLIQQFELTLLEGQVHPHLGATLEPRPGVMMRTCCRRRS